MNDSDLALISAIAAAASAITSIIVAFKSTSLTKKMFKRQNVIDLHLSWRDTNDIDPNNPIGPDVKKAANSLDLTASLWNHDIVEKEIIFQSYWIAFRNLYDVLYNSRTLVPGYNKECKDFISKEVASAYEDMKRYENRTVKKTTI